MMDCIDSHCHFDVEAFDPDREQVWARAGSLGIRKLVLPSIRRADWGRVHATACAFQGVHPAYGLHPVYLLEHAADDLIRLDHWLDGRDEAGNAVMPAVAVGECGLDGFVPGLDFDAQWMFFTVQLDLALAKDLPVIIHARRAVDQVTKALRQRPGLRGVVHSFSGSLQQAGHLLDLGFMLGFGGPVTYPRAARLRSLVARLPRECLLVETDAPDQPGLGHQGQRNEPAFLIQVIREIALLRGDEPEAVARFTADNARRLFRLEH